MIVAGNAEVRRLRYNRRTLAIIVMLIVTTLVWDDHTMTFVVLCANAVVWAMMFIEVHRELSQIAGPIESATKSITKEARMK
jgi:hypothetical protein